VKYGFVLPMGDARQVADLAQAAEKAGWDGIFVWEPVWGIDAWVSLAAAAMLTTRIRLGTMLTPLSRMRPWKLASETVTLDRLSNGRVILAVGLGAVDTGFTEFGEETDRKRRAGLLDEGLEILTGLWKGQPFQFEGQHYQVKPTNFMPPPPPVQQPRIPIWVVGAWPSEKSMARAMRWDGLLPSVLKPGAGAGQASPEELGRMAEYIQARRSDNTPYDIVVEGETPGDQPDKAREIIEPWQAAGATWWTETRWNVIRDADAVLLVRQRIEQGPPR
jgi:alkanesulfonate monooxygenase SsuD/methylene tetrahydromethanopterin reductase-like flavin-dependent oxidoreductase (luciferase family)